MEGLLCRCGRQLAGLLLGGLLLCWVGNASADQERMTIEMRQGESKLIDSAASFNRVSVADPLIADVHVLSPKEAYIYGKKVGYTSMILWEGERKTMIDVVVVLDLSGLKEKIYTLYPEQQIKVYGTQTGIVLAGTVSGPEIMEQVLRLAQAYLPTAKGGEESSTGKSGATVGVTNLLTVRGVQQVMLEVKFAEVSRDSGRDLQAALGVSNLTRYGKDWQNFQGNIATAPLSAAGIDIGNAASMLMNFASNPANIFLKADNLTAALTFMESESLARILAEPKLIALSGQEASFLAGGEFPIPVYGENNTVTIQYKQFGVGLTFTPYVLSNGKISLYVTPEVSQITGASPIGNYVAYNLSTRRLKTTVELNDGQTLALAGLLQDDIRETVSKVPGLGDLPVIGALFRSTSYQQSKTDLLIAVTPHLVKPVDKEELSFPGENFQTPSRMEYYLLGQLEGRGQQQQRAATKVDGGLEGDFGHQPLTR